MVKVLMIGPGEDTVGGIRTLVETLLPKLNTEVDLQYFPTVSNRPTKKSGKLSLGNIYITISQYLKFVNQLLRFQPEIIHLHTSQGLGWLKDTFYVIMGKLFKCFIVIHINAAGYEGLYSQQSRIFKWYTRKIMLLADRVIAPSFEWQLLINNIVPIERIVTFRNCINTKQFLFPALRHTDFNRINLLFIGSVGPRKGAFDLIKAIDLLKTKEYDLHVWFAGYEEREGDLQKAETCLDELKIQEKCELLGTVIGDKKLQLLSEADIFVLPTYSEGLPLAIGEALAAGLPIISTPVGGIPEVIEDGYNGFLIQPGDVRGLSNRIAALAKNPQLREVMGQRSRKIAEQKLDVDNFVHLLLGLYHDLLP